MWTNGSNGTEGVTAPNRPSSFAEGKATIGPSVSVKGEISGQEDILIEGTVEGLINLKQNVVTIAKSGKVKANIYGIVVHVEGEVTGDLFGTERVIVHQSGRVRGNISAPKIAIEEGARVKGALNTDEAEGATESVREGRSKGEEALANARKAALTGTREPAGTPPVA